jgi:hypothetical protein
MRGTVPPKVRPTPLERLLAACPDDLPDDPSERRQSVITMGRAAQAFAKQPGVDEWAVPYARAIEGAARGLVQGERVDDGPAFSALEEAVGGLQTAINLRRAEVGGPT